jgi:hypothetical protein
MIRSPSKLSIVTLTAMLAPCALANITIDPAQSYVVGTRPSGVAVADFNGNGHLDLATVVDNPDRVVTLINNGFGQYMLGPAFFLPASSSPQDIIAGDFNNDGHADLAVAVRDPVGSVIILSGTGTGSFVNAGTYQVGSRPRGLSIGDADGNGYLDIAVANRDGDSASVLFNTAGVFTVLTIPTGQEPRATVLADFTGSGLLDLAVTNHNDRTVSVFTNTTGTAFAPSQTLSVGAQLRPEGITAADLNNNGLVDIAIASSGTAGHFAAVFWNTGAAFTGPSNYPTGGQDTGHIVAADLDCDGWIDLVTSNQNTNNASVMRNLGGSFALHLISPAGIRPGRVAIGDLTGNGAPDFVIANRDSDSLTVHHNTSEGCEPQKPCAPADLNCDGVVDVLDLLILLDAWGACMNCGDCPADLNGDCEVDVLDLLHLLDAWG